jgi:hypothetical protein
MSDFLAGFPPGVTIIIMAQLSLMPGGNELSGAMP